MKLSAGERERLDVLIAALALDGSRTAPGLPGCRAQPLSCKLLVEQRRAGLAGARD